MSILLEDVDDPLCEGLVFTCAGRPDDAPDREIGRATAERPVGLEPLLDRTLASDQPVEVVECLLRLLRDDDRKAKLVDGRLALLEVDLPRSDDHPAALRQPLLGDALELLTDLADHVGCQ